MSRRHTPHGQRYGHEVATGYRHTTRVPGPLHREPEPRLRWPTVLAIVVMFAVLAVVVNGDLILNAIGGN